MIDDASALTVHQVAKRWNCSRIAIYLAIKDKRLAAFRVSKRVFRIMLDEVLRFEKAKAA